MRQQTEKGKTQPANDTRDQQSLFLCAGDRDIFFKRPPEEAETGMVGKLEKSLYGTRDVGGP